MFVPSLLSFAIIWGMQHHSEYSNARRPPLLQLRLLLFDSSERAVLYPTRIEPIAQCPYANMASWCGQDCLAVIRWE